MTCETVNSTLSHCVENVLEEKKTVLRGEENCSSRRRKLFFKEKKTVLRGEENCSSRRRKLFFEFFEEKKTVLRGEENCSSRRSGSFVGLHGMNWAHARYEVAVAVPAFRVVQDVHCSGAAFHTLSARKE